MTVIRAFIAVSLSDEIYHGLTRVMDDLKSRTPAAAVRWVAAHNIHLTLKFLGDVSMSNLENVNRSLQACAAEFGPFDVHVSGLGAFPSPKRPRVVWVGLSAPASLGALQRSVENAMARLGYPPEERSFSPHLTIGRVARTAGPADLQRLSAVLEGVKVGELGSVRVDSFHIYKSDLRPTGPIYTRLASFPVRSND